MEGTSFTYRKGGLALRSMLLFLFAGFLLLSCEDKPKKTNFDDEVNITKRLYLKCKDKGLIIRPVGNVAILSPPLTMDKAAIDTAVSIIKESIIELTNEL